MRSVRVRGHRRWHRRLAHDRAEISQGSTAPFEHGGSLTDPSCCKDHPGATRTGPCRRNEPRVFRSRRSDLAPRLQFGRLPTGRKSATGRLSPDDLLFRSRSGDLEALEGGCPGTCCASVWTAASHVFDSSHGLNGVANLLSVESSKWPWWLSRQLEGRPLSLPIDGA